jgi:competence protein ComFA
MRVVVYAVLCEGRWLGRISLDASLEVDKLFWSNKSQELVRLAGDMPYGDALDMLGEWDAKADVKQSRPEHFFHDAHTISLEHEQIAATFSNMDKLADALKGRSLLWEELVSLLEHLGIDAGDGSWKKYVQWGYLEGFVQLQGSVDSVETSGIIRWLRRKVDVCRRCGSTGAAIRRTACASCGEESCAYCESCLTMGRARRCSPLIVGVDVEGRAYDDRWNLSGERAYASSGDALTRPGAMESAASLLASQADTIPFVPLGDWQLSPAQTEAAQEGLRFLANREGAGARRSNGNGNTDGNGADRNVGVETNGARQFLIWAVTGAGKTEMMFPLVADELMRGGRVLIATPRRDVVLELLPRIKAAFPRHTVAALYGGSSQRWDCAAITVATTHQLLRFEGAFNLVVIDEIDAFPYHNNPVLTYAAKKACAQGGAFVLLSATPPAQLQMDAKRGKLPHVKVPVRYHRHPLPVPRLKRYGGLVNLGAHGGGGLEQALSESLQRGAQVFVFVPKIERLAPTLAWLRHRLHGVCPYGQIDATSSQDAERHEKVLRLRSGDIRILLTTTILERGVTIPKADVIVLDADSALFDAAALVQMAGRAGRSAADPFGRVLFLARDKTRSQVEALRQIRAMNRLAHRKGYLAPK